jgi:beta-lactamase regulating signal transducer with metallopeptidase domain
VNFLERLYPGDALAIGTLNVLVQVAIVPLLALLVSRTFANRNAALRHFVLLATLLWIIASPLAAWRLNRAGLFTLRFPSTSHGVEAPTKDHSPQAASPDPDSVVMIKSINKSPSIAQTHLLIETPVPRQPKPVPRPTVNKLHASIGTLILIWISITCVLLLRLIRGLYLVFQISRHSTLAAVPDSVRQQVCRTLGIEQLPPILVSRRLSSPATIGIIHPAIVFPAGLLDQITPHELHDVLIHECMHWLRHDYPIGIVQCLVAAALWFHPMVHLLNRQLRRAREEVCDNAVLANRAPAQYSRTLLTLAQRIQTARTPTLLPGFFDHASPLEHRVAGLLSQRRVVMTRVSKRARLAVTTSVAILGFILSAVGVFGAQSPVQTESQTTAPATAPAASLAARIERNSKSLSIDPADLISPDEEALQSNLAGANRAVRRAELTVQEAEIKAKAAQMDLNRKVPLLASKSIPDSEIEQAKLDLELAQIELERAKIGLDEAAAAAVPTRLVALSLWDSQNQAPDQYGQYSVRSDSRSVHFFIQQHFKDALRGGWEISLLRQSRTQPVVIFTGVRNLDSKSSLSNQLLQAGDWICIRRDMVRILKGPNDKSPVIWETTLGGNKLTIPELLRLAGIQYGIHDESRHIRLSGRRIGWAGRDKQWNASLAQIANGFGKDEVLEPDDIVILNSPTP